MFFAICRNAIYVSVCACVCPPVCLSFFLCKCMSLSICECIDMAFCSASVSVCASVYVSVCLSFAARCPSVAAVWRFCADSLDSV